MDATFNRVVTVTAEGSLRVELVQPNVVCVAYTNEYSVGHKSEQDLLIGIMGKAVASNQKVLDRTPDGSYVIVTCQDDRGRLSKCVIGRLGGHRSPTVMWKEFARITGQTGGHVWKYVRDFTPLTPVLSVHALREEFYVPRSLFNSRLCGYGHPPRGDPYAPLVRQIVERHPLA
jgi:hypothetical protein